ncbi:hypothetical protein GCM10009525_86860 [Streptosporangium amethystogenes subsp. fukuiense]
MSFLPGASKRAAKGRTGVRLALRTLPLFRIGHASARAAPVYRRASRDRDKVIAAAPGGALTVAREKEKRKSVAHSWHGRSVRVRETQKARSTICRLTWPFCHSERTTGIEPA